MSLIFRLFVAPYRRLRLSYGKRPLASNVLRAYIRQRDYPSWTSYFVEYRQIQDDDFGAKHFNFDVDGHNYHVLRVGCFPYIKYHCTQRPREDLSNEDKLFRLITVANLGIPSLLYGLAAIGLIRHTDRVCEPKTGATYSTHSAMVAPSCCLEYRPTAYFWAIIVFVVFPAIYLSGKVIGCVCLVVFRLIRAVIRFIYYDYEEDYEPQQEEPQPKKERTRVRNGTHSRKHHNNNNSVAKVAPIVEPPPPASSSTPVGEETRESDVSDTHTSECEEVSTASVVVDDNAEVSATTAGLLQDEASGSTALSQASSSQSCALGARAVNNAEIRQATNRKRNGRTPVKL